MNYDPEAIARALELRRGQSVDRARIALALFNRDFDTDLAAARPRVRYEVWDQKMPINGVDPGTIKTRSDYQGGEIYLVYIDNALAYLQPHDPFVDGYVPMSKENVDQRAQEHVDRIVETLTLEKTISELENSIPVPPPTTPVTVPVQNSTTLAAVDVNGLTIDEMRDLAIYEPEYLEWKDRRRRGNRGRRG